MRRESGEVGVLGVGGFSADGEPFTGLLVGLAPRGEARSALRAAVEASLLSVLNCSAFTGGEKIVAAGKFLRSFAFTCLRGMPMSTDLSIWS